MFDASTSGWFVNTRDPAWFWPAIRTLEIVAGHVSTRMERAIPLQGAANVVSTMATSRTTKGSMGQPLLDPHTTIPLALTLPAIATPWSVAELDRALIAAQ